MNRRRSIRLKDYDYSQPGAYFVTICTRNRERVLGEIVGGTVTLSPVVDLVQTTWLAIRHNYPGVDVDEFIVMPSHLHGIILLTGATDLGKADQDQGEAIGQARGPGPTSPLPDVVHRFKSLTTARYRQGVKRDGQLRSSDRLWQRNYYEQVIRDDDDLDRVREYIAGNPASWDDDEYNPNG